MYCLDVVGCMVTECAGALADGDDVAPDATELLRIALGGIVELVDGVSSALSL